MIRLLYSFVAVAFFLNAIPSNLFAQETLPIKTNTPVEATGVLNCFDYYRFGSVQAVMAPSVVGTVTGSPITFSGKLANANEYPLIDGTLYAKVFRNDETTFAAGDGNPVVDQFIVKEDISLAANSEMDISHDWTVPIFAKSGDYYIAYFFVTSDRYNLMGLSFTDDVVGNTASFSVVAEEGALAPTELSKINTTLNGRDHHFAAVPLTFAKGERVIVSTTVTNSSSETKVLPLQWNQYAWDAMNPDNRRNTKTEIITLAPQETKTVSYEVKTQRESVVYMSVIVQDKDAKSILNIRYVQDDVEETRINFPSISNFPLKTGEATTLFACAHSTNLPIVEGNTLTLELLDREGVVIHSYKYEGSIAGEMVGFGESFTPNSKHDYVTLNAKLERDGVVIEEVSIVYDCSVIDASKCGAEENGLINGSTPVQQIVLIMVGLGSLIVIFIVIMIYFRRKGMRNISGPKVMSIVALLLLGAGVFTPSGVEAKTVSWNHVDNAGTYYAHWGWYGYENYNISSSDGGNGWMDALRNPNYTITYGANVYNDSAGGTLVADGSSISIGTQLRFAPESFDSSDISWFGTGYSNDSPNGDWVAGAGPSHNSPAEINSFTNSMACRAEDYVGSVPANTGGNWDIHIPMSVNPPSVTVSHGGTAGLSCDASQLNCTVTSAGTISSTFTFTQTNAKLYYRYSNTLGYDMINPKADVNNCDSSAVRLIADPETNGGLEPCRFRVRDGACFGDNTPLSKDQSTDFSLAVPQQTISFSLTVPGAVNNNPNSPAITGSTVGNVNTSHTFSVSATDGDGDSIAYEIDWDNNGSVDARVPAVGFVSSGTSVNTARSWTSNGVKTFQARTVDDAAGLSSWASHSITISTVAPTATISGTGCTILVGASTCNGLITWTSNNTNLPTVRNVTRDALISSNANGTNISATLTQGSNYVIVRDDTVLVNSTSLSAGCASGSSWDGSSCIASACQPDGFNQAIVPPVCCSGTYSSDVVGSCTYYDNNSMPYGGSICLNLPSYTCTPGPAASVIISGTNCTIPSGASSCTSNLTWNFSNTVTPNIFNLTTNSTYSNSLTGNNFAAIVGYGTSVIAGRDGVSNLGLVNIIADCAIGTVWNGLSCNPPASVDLKINGSDGPITVSYLDSLLITWSGSIASTCSGFGNNWSGGSLVPSSGSATVVASMSDTYIISCVDGSDSVVVTVLGGSAPAAPTINGPTNSGANVNNTFTINAVDPDGDDLYYEIDWDNNGSVDASTPGIGYVPSGTDRTAIRSWATGGSYTFSVRAVDDTLLYSGWTSHAITVSAPPIITVESQVNTGGWSGADQTINPGDTLNILWTSTGATSCTNNFGVGGNATNNSGVSVTSPAPNSSLTYSVTCTGPGGTVVDNIIVRTNNLPNLTTPIINHNISAATVDPVTGEYDSFEIYFQTGNDGESPAGASTYRIDISNGIYSSSQTGVLPAIGARGSVNISRLFDNVPLGPLTVIVTVDSNSVVTEVYENDNVGTYYPILTPQKPLNFDITATPDVVREGQSATIGWDAGVTYPLDCTVSGPGLTPSPYTFDPSIDGRVGSEVTGPLSAKSEYLLSCTESITNTTFTETVSVEVVPTAEEV